MPKKTFAKMRASELSAAVKQFDEEFVPTSPLTAADRAKHRRARGRPRIGAGVDRFSVSVESGLMSRATKFAKATNLSRSALVAAGIRLLLEQDESKGATTKAKRSG